MHLAQPHGKRARLHAAVGGAGRGDGEEEPGGPAGRIAPERPAIERHRRAHGVEHRGAVRLREVDGGRRGEGEVRVCEIDRGETVRRHVEVRGDLILRQVGRSIAEVIAVQVHGAGRGIEKLSLPVRAD